MWRPCKGFRILEYGTILLVESRIWKILVVLPKFLGCWIRNTVQLVHILLTIGIRSSTNKESGTQYKESGIHSMEYRILDFIGFPYMERYVALHLRDRSKAVALRYRHRADITVFILEQKPYPVWFSCRRKSYPVYFEHSLNVLGDDLWRWCTVMFNKGALYLDMSRASTAIDNSCCYQQLLIQLFMQ